MKNLQLIVISMLVLHFQANAQNLSREFGKIGIDEILLSEYSRDPSAEAVVLYDKGKSYFERNDNGLT